MKDDAILSNILSVTPSEISTTGTTPNGLLYVYSASKIIKNSIDFSGRVLHEESDDSFIGLCAVGLPFFTSTHLIAIPKNKPDTLDIPAHVKSMELVELEGDYSSYFTLYASQDEQLEIRVLLDPSAMAFSIDFCAAYYWEIVNNTLYFVAEGQLPDLKIIDDFVKQFTPANSTATTIQLHQRPQSFEKLSSSDSHLKCPVCNVALLNGKSWLACPNGHGYLLTGSQLTATRQHMNDLQRTLEKILGSRPNVVYRQVVIAHGELNCPNDGTIFMDRPYQETNAHLYVCHTCAYHWIDGQDLDTILGKFRNDGFDDPEDSYV